MDPIVEVYPEFSRLVDYRKEFNKRNYDSLLKTGSQDWYSPEGDKFVTELDSVRDDVNVHNRFETPKIEEAFLKLMKNTGIQSDMMAIQKQFHYVAENENAFKRRHTTVPRLLAHRLGIKAITALGGEEDMLNYVVNKFIAIGTKQLRNKR